MSGRYQSQQQLDRGCPALKSCAVGQNCSMTLDRKACLGFEDSHSESEKLPRFRCQSRKGKEASPGHGYPVYMLQIPKWRSTGRSSCCKAKPFYLPCSSEQAPCIVPRGTWCMDQVWGHASTVRFTWPSLISSMLYDIGQLSHRAHSNWNPSWSPALRDRDKSPRNVNNVATAVRTSCSLIWPTITCFI